MPWSNTSNSGGTNGEISKKLGKFTSEAPKLEGRKPICFNQIESPIYFVKVQTGFGILQRSVSKNFLTPATASVESCKLRAFRNSAAVRRDKPVLGLSSKKPWIGAGYWGVTPQLFGVSFWGKSNKQNIAYSGPTLQCWCHQCKTLPSCAAFRIYRIRQKQVPTQTQNFMYLFDFSQQQTCMISCKCT